MQSAFFLDRMTYCIFQHIIVHLYMFPQVTGLHSFRAIEGVIKKRVNTLAAALARCEFSANTLG